MKCPHCLDSFFEKWIDQTQYLEGSEGTHVIQFCQCPSCRKFTIRLNEKILERNMWKSSGNYVELYPKTISRDFLSPLVPDEFANDYREACLVLKDSPKASAALSRRCLQHILREKAGIKKENLFNEIQAVIDSKELPSYLAENIDEIRKIGKYAAHPKKSKLTGEIVDVEPHEAEWNLDVLEGLFDFYFVQAESAKKKRELLKKKIDDVKTPTK
jgi:hypothetical protein